MDVGLAGLVWFGGCVELFFGSESRDFDGSGMFPNIVRRHTR